MDYSCYSVSFAEPLHLLSKYLSKTLRVYFHGGCNMFTVVSVLYFFWCKRSLFVFAWLFVILQESASQEFCQNKISLYLMQ